MKSNMSFLKMSLSAAGLAAVATGIAFFPGRSEPEQQASIDVQTVANPAPAPVVATPAVAPAPVAAPAPAETGTLKIKFVYEGDAFEPEKLKATADPNFCGKFDLPNERLLVNKENKGIKNIVVYMYVKGDDDGGAPAAEPKTHVLANKNCRFEPRVVVARKGDTLKVTNPDDVSHNANLQFWENAQANPLIPAGGEHSVELEKAEPAASLVSCSIHPWMQARVFVFNHPYAAVSDENGELTIEGLPAGEEIQFRVNHEIGPIKEVIIDGEETDWRRSIFEIEIEPGLNDMGTVVVPEDVLEVD